MVYPGYPYYLCYSSKEKAAGSSEVTSLFSFSGNQVHPSCWRLLCTSHAWSPRPEEGSFIFLPFSTNITLLILSILPFSLHLVFLDESPHSFPCLRSRSLGAFIWISWGITDVDIFLILKSVQWSKHVLCWGPHVHAIDSEHIFGSHALLGYFMLSLTCPFIVWSDLLISFSFIVS